MITAAIIVDIKLTLINAKLANCAYKLDMPAVWNTIVLYEPTK
jgi:hypothetical protein